MKKIGLIGVCISLHAHANFDFGTCAGSGTFEQKIVHYNGDYNKDTDVGIIPKEIQGLKVRIISDKDVDLRLYGENNDKIVHWPKGILNHSFKSTKPYKNIPITYSGYNGIQGKRGHEFITIDGSTPTEMLMKVFGYESGFAIVNYSWTGKTGCTKKESGSGSFHQKILGKSTTLVGTIPPNMQNVEIRLSSDKDLDIQLYAIDGTAIVSWKPKGILSGKSKQTVNYHGMKIEWSGYNGTDGKKGNEYIKIYGQTTEMLVMKVYGYEAGEALVNYHWGTTGNDNDHDGLSNDIEKDLGMDPNKKDDLGGRSASERYAYRVMNRLAYGVNIPLKNDILKEGGVDAWIQKQLATPQTTLGTKENPVDEIQAMRDNYKHRNQKHTNVLPTIRSIKSKYQLQTVMGHFWDNHFNTLSNRGYLEMPAADDFYLHAFGNFETLLLLSAKSPAMLKYLNGEDNKKGAMNENYAREVMELHTLGEGNGYTSQDIISLARILTGWSYSKKKAETCRYIYYKKGEEKDKRVPYFTFDSDEHDNTGKSFLNHTISSTAQKQGEDALKILARHPNTATFICKKLIHKFVSDKIDTNLLTACRSTFTQQVDAPDQIAKVLHTIFSSDAFKKVTASNLKLKTTQEYFLSLARLLELDPIRYDGVEDKKTANIGWLLVNTNQAFYKKFEPTGYAERSDLLLNSNMVSNRMGIAQKILYNTIYNISLVDFFKKHHKTTIASILRFLIPDMTAGQYTLDDIKESYHILKPDDIDFDINHTKTEHRLRVLVGYLATQAEMNIQ